MKCNNMNRSKKGDWGKWRGRIMLMNYNGVQGANMEAGLGGRKRKNILLEQDISRDGDKSQGCIYFYKTEDSTSVDKKSLVHYQLH